MDPNEAREQLDLARESQRASALPAASPWVAVASGILIGGGLALAGQAASDKWLRAGFLGGAIVLIACGVLVYSAARRRLGLRGLGSARSQASTFFICAVAIAIPALSATADARWIYVGLGVAVGLLVIATLRKRI